MTWEQAIHINCLELLAATLTVQTFAQEKLSISILLRKDNMTTVAYINSKERTVSPTLSHRAKTLWWWCMERNISLEAQHFPGVMNSIADRESRAWLDRSEWKLSPNIIQKINSQLGPLSTDLFASRLSNKLLKFVSWKPDPLAMATDSFTLTSSDLPQKVYVNSPWNLIGIVLSQVYNQHIRAHFNSPSVESPSLVPSVSTEVGQSTNPLSHVIRDDTVSVSELPPRHFTPTSRVCHIRERCHLSGTATDLVLSSWREKSSKCCDSSFCEWASWCNEWDRDPICDLISDLPIS